MTDLIMPLKREYFEAIRNGKKHEEYRLHNEYWAKRLCGRTYDRVVLTLGYPNRDDNSRRIVRQWRGYEIKRITHPHFGSQAVNVFAIDVRG